MMRRTCEIFVALACAGCNVVFGLEPTVLVDGGDGDAAIVPPDRDHDGIADPEDPCIASIADDKTDADGDSYPNDTDPCPIDYEGIDSDGDGIFNECDPLWMVGQERRRCFMAFQNGNINLALWQPRGVGVWDLISGPLIGRMTGTVVAAESFEAAVSTSYDATVRIGLPTGESAVTLWLRTGDTASSADVGCELRGTTTMTRLALLGAPTPLTMSFASPLQSVDRFQAVIVPGATPGTNNVYCAVRFMGSFPGVGIAAELPLPPGRLGFSVENAVRVVFTSLLVLERDAPPPL